MILAISIVGAFSSGVKDGIETSTQENVITEDLKQENKESEEMEKKIKNCFIGYDVDNIDDENGQYIYNVFKTGNPLKTEWDDICYNYIHSGEIIFIEFEDKGISEYILKAKIIDEENKENTLTYEISMSKDTFKKYNWNNISDKKLYEVFAKNEDIKLNIY